MALKNKSGEALPDAKKRKRVGFSIDSGVEPNKCMEIFLVQSPDDMSATDSCSIDPVDLSDFFGEDGKIYGYKNLKIKICLSLVSFCSYADITYESMSDGGKGVTDLKAALQRILGESLIGEKEFLDSFSTESQFIKNVLSSGAFVPSDFSGEGGGTLKEPGDGEASNTEVIRMNINSYVIGLLYSRLAPFVLLLIEGSRPIDITDPFWEIYFIAKKERHEAGDHSLSLLGFAAVYRFYHYPDSTRLRISQILILPPYQGHGYGRLLLSAVNHVAISENAFDVTIEEPSKHLQDIRTRMDALRLLAFDPTREAISSAVSVLRESNQRPDKTHNSGLGPLLQPPGGIVEATRQALKINKKQLQRCWEVLIYRSLDSNDRLCIENFRTAVSDFIRANVLGRDSESGGRRLVEVPNNYNHDMTFVVFRGMPVSIGDKPNSNGGGTIQGYWQSQVEQLNQAVDEQLNQIADIAKMI